MRLDKAAVVAPFRQDRDRPIAVTVLVEEVERRTGVRLPVAAESPDAARPAIVLAIGGAGDLPAPWRQRLGHLATPGPEGYRLLSDERDGQVLVLGADARGLLFGVGRLLRRLRLQPGEVTLDEPLAATSSPKSQVRGHQLGYRPLNNTYDAWTVAQYDRAIRELALFGANTIEFVPPGADDAGPTAPHMPVDPWRMLTECSRICDRYGLDVSLWYPNEGKDFTSDEGIRRELDERSAIFASMPRLDGLFIPGGDPGGLDPDTLLAWSARVAALLRRHHPNARVCLSAQAFKADDAWLEAFFRHLRAGPDWLDQVAFAPWVRVPLPELRRRVPSRYPIRRYPDITHCLLCQYPVPEWDPAWAMTAGREPITPRPVAMKHIHNLFKDHAIGGVTYSEGVNDDVNKFVWADQDWDPDTPVETTLRDYARLFIAPSLAERVAEGLLALERNWRGPIAQNDRIEETLALWQSIEAQAGERVAHNWRFEMHLLRACFDAFIRRRLTHETALEGRALAALRSAPNGGATAAMAQATALLARRTDEPVAVELHDRCCALADRLWEHIGIQLTTTRHHGQRTVRGAFLDSIDVPLNDEAWLLERFAAIREMDAEGARDEALRAVAHRTDPGAGGVYDNFGAAPTRGRVEPGRGSRADPGFYATPLIVFSLRPGPGEPLAWRSAVSTLYDPPLTIRYDGLRLRTPHTLRVTYQPDPWGHRIRLTANTRLLHDWLEVRGQCRTETFTVPADLLADGRLELVWASGDGELGPRVAELWLIPTPDRDEAAPPEGLS